MRIDRWLAILLLGVALQATAQTAPAGTSCATAEARQFDFWLGSWTARFVNNNTAVTGSNTVSALYDGCVIFEQFDGAPGSPLKGLSHSVYDVNAKRWKQTWVDNTGSYLDFTGGWEGDRMILAREAERNGKRFLQRMVWFDIRPDTFNWHWERSDDGGKTWTVSWRIEYRRK